MYGITLDFDALILEEKTGIDKESAYEAIERCLADIGYARIQHGTYLCTDPKTSEILVVHNTIEALKKIDWFSEAVNRIVAFELNSWGDLLGSFKR